MKYTTYLKYKEDCIPKIYEEYLRVYGEQSFNDWPPYQSRTGGIIDSQSPVTDLIFEHTDTEINIAVETGTNLGRTAMNLSTLYDRVFTVEKYAENYRHLYSKIKENFKNIDFYVGDAEIFIREMCILHPNEKMIFWLDAHNGTQEVPLLEEIKAIREYSNRKDHLIMIDDGEDMGQGNFPSLEEISKELKEINKDYNIIQSHHGRNIIVCKL